jgi:uncharacterized membrane protein
MTVRSRHHDGYIQRSSRQRPDRERNRVRIEDVGQERTPPHNAGSLEPVARPAIMECAMSSAEIVPDIVTTRQADKSVADDWNAASRGRSRASGIRTMQEDTALAYPVVRTIGIMDLKEALIRGFDDFKARPSHVFFLGVIYPLVAFMSARLAFGMEVVPLLFPLIAGLTLVGPFAAIGLYELSRRRELGLEASWRHAFGVLRSRSVGAIATLGAVLMMIFVMWLGTALLIYNLAFGSMAPLSIEELVRQVFTTPSGWFLLVAGNGVGFVFAVVVLTISVISFPLLLDRDIGAGPAIRTSVRAVLANPTVMAMWGLVVAGSLTIGSAPCFVGLAVVMPVLGHSTWHLYRKVIEPGVAQ